jgi:hypothetical protein
VVLDVLEGVVVDVVDVDVVDDDVDVVDDDDDEVAVHTAHRVKPPTGIVMD